MSFLRPHFLWMVLFQMTIGSLAIRAETATTSNMPAGGRDALMAALPERSLPGLDALLKEALANAPTVLMRRWEVEQSVQNTYIARASLLPNARANASSGVILEQRNDSGVKSDRSVAAVLYNAGISQPVYYWGALVKNHDVAKLAQAISARNLDETRRLLAVDLRRRYQELVIVEGSIDVTRKRIRELNRQLQFANKQVEDGFAASTAGALIAADIAALELSLQSVENDRDMRRYDLARVSGVSVERLPASVAELPKPGDLDAAVKALSTKTLARVPSVRLQNADDSVRAEKLRYEIEKTRLKPKLGASFSVGQDNRNADNDAFGQKTLITSWAAFATVDWQLFDGFSAKASQRASLARVRLYEEDRELAARQESDEQRTDLNRLQLYWRQLQQAEAGLSNARSIVTSIEKDVAAGWVPASENILAQQGVDAALQAVNGARANFYTALATYFSNLGIDPVLQTAAR